jgi:osmoprotectant transport system permease protein
MNGEVEIDGRSFAETAQRFLARQGLAGAAGAASAPGAASALQPARAGLLARIFAPDFARLAGQHLLLVFVSLAAAIVVGVPIGIAAWRWPRSASLLLGAVAVLQTVPSLALLAFLIALVGSIGVVPALIALFLYALLPIVRNTHAGLQGVSRDMAQAALSLGLTARQALVHVQLPLAAPMLLAGIKTAAVINVGTATMAAFIGAGGFGERIVAGLAVNDKTVMLAGALPAAVLALLVQWGFDLAERRAAGGRAVERA